MSLGRIKDKRAWSRAEHVLAFRLYSELPFGKLHHRNPKIIELAALLGRTAGSVAMKLNNFASIDPQLAARGIKGLSSIAKGVHEVWDEFAREPEKLIYESELLLADYCGTSIDESAQIDSDDLPTAPTEREAVVKLRVNQAFFRRRILALYNCQCCVTGLTLSDLLVASHIVPWSEDAANRLNPRNGLCLNALHDRAFDRFLMWIEDDFTIRFRPELIQRGPAWLTEREGEPLILPGGVSPDPSLLRRHRERCSAQRD